MSMTPSTITATAPARAAVIRWTRSVMIASIVEQNMTMERI